MIRFNKSQKAHRKVLGIIDFILLILILLIFRNWTVALIGSFIICFILMVGKEKLDAYLLRTKNARILLFWGGLGLNGSRFDWKDILAGYVGVFTIHGIFLFGIIMVQILQNI